MNLSLLNDVYESQIVLKAAKRETRLSVEQQRILLAAAQNNLNQALELLASTPEKEVA